MGLAADPQAPPETMQAKLQTVWDSLLMPTLDRLSFMRKYTTDGYRWVCVMRMVEKERWR